MRATWPAIANFAWEKGLDPGLHGRAHRNGQELHFGPGAWEEGNMPPHTRGGRTRVRSDAFPVAVSLVIGLARTDSQPVWRPLKGVQHQSRSFGSNRKTHPSVAKAQGMDADRHGCNAGYEPRTHI